MLISAEHVTGLIVIDCSRNNLRAGGGSAVRYHNSG
jgi:hypothetical protein